MPPELSPTIHPGVTSDMPQWLQDSLNQAWLSHPDNPFAQEGPVPAPVTPQIAPTTPPPLVIDPNQPAMAQISAQQDAMNQAQAAAMDQAGIPLPSFAQLPAAPTFEPTVGGASQLTGDNIFGLDQEALLRIQQGNQQLSDAQRLGLTANQYREYQRLIGLNASHEDALADARKMARRDVGDILKPFFEGIFAPAQPGDAAFTTPDRVGTGAALFGRGIAGIPNIADALALPDDELAQLRAEQAAFTSGFAPNTAAYDTFVENELERQLERIEEERIQQDLLDATAFFASMEEDDLLGGASQLEDETIAPVAGPASTGDLAAAQATLEAGSPFPEHTQLLDAININDPRFAEANFESRQLSVETYEAWFGEQGVFGSGNLGAAAMPDSMNEVVFLAALQMAAADPFRAFGYTDEMKQSVFANDPRMQALREQQGGENDRADLEETIKGEIFTQIFGGLPTAENIRGFLERYGYVQFGDTERWDRIPTLADDSLYGQGDGGLNLYPSQLTLPDFRPTKDSIYSNTNPGAGLFLWRI
jgi:hypothetical protein